MTIFNLTKDADIQLLINIAKAGVKTKVIWTVGNETCIDYVTHEDYVKAKQCQIKLGKTKDDVPIV